MRTAWKPRCSRPMAAQEEGLSTEKEPLGSTHSGTSPFQARWPPRWAEEERAKVK